MERKTNWAAVVVSAVAGVFIGFLWYGMLFQTQWMAGNGMTSEGEKMFKDGVEIPMSATPMIVNFVAMLVYALLINWLLGLTRAANWTDGLKVGGAVGLIMTIGIHIGNMFAQNPHTLSMVDGSYSLVLFAVMGAILGGWQKR